MVLAVSVVRTVDTRSEWTVGMRRHGAWSTHIIGVHVRRRHTGTRHCRRQPSILMHIVVIGADITRRVHHTYEGAVARHVPRKRRHSARVAETHIISGTVHVVAIEKPYARQVYRHINLLAGVGIVAENPYFVVLTVDTFHPNIGKNHIGCKLVLIAAIDHQFGLSVQRCNHPRSLRMSEETDVVGRRGEQQSAESH